MEWQPASMDPHTATAAFGKTLLSRGLTVSELEDGKLLMQTEHHQFLLQLKSIHADGLFWRMMFIAPLPFGSGSPASSIHSFVNYLNGKYDAGSFHVVGDRLVFMTQLVFRESLDLLLFSQYTTWITAFLDNLFREEARYVQGA